MPAGMDARLGALVEPLANGVHAIRSGAPAGATSAVVIGAGTIGLACMQAALVHGIELVTVLERHPTRREHALRLGANEAFATGDELKPGVDLVVDAAGADATRQLAIELLNPAGTAVFIGLYADPPPLPWPTVHRGNPPATGVLGYPDPAKLANAIEHDLQGRRGPDDHTPTEEAATLLSA